MANGGHSVDYIGLSRKKLVEDWVDTLLLTVGFFMALVALRVLAERGPQLPPHPFLERAWWCRAGTVKRLLRVVIISCVLITAVVLILSTLRP
jgi:hypothetical protein